MSTDAFHVVGTDGNDVIRTGGGDDLIVDGIGDGNDVYDGGNGTDTVDYSSATSSLTVDLTATDRSGEAASPAAPSAILLVNAGYVDDTPVGKATGTDIGTDALINIENVVGGHAGDDITGDAANNVIVGGGGDRQPGRRRRHRHCILSRRRLRLPRSPSTRALSPSPQAVRRVATP